MRKGHKNILIILLLLAVIIAAGMVYDAYFKKEQQQAPSSERTVRSRLAEIPLHEQNDSGVTGRAFIVESGEGIEVSISLSDANEREALRPAHIHNGTCDNLGGIAFPLSDIQNTGPSETTLEASFDILSSQIPLAINVHESEENISAYIACGNITKSALEKFR